MTAFGATSPLPRVPAMVPSQSGLQTFTVEGSDGGDPDGIALRLSRWLADDEASALRVSVKREMIRLYAIAEEDEPP
jgi:hypothetical protein